MSVGKENLFLLQSLETGSIGGIKEYTVPHVESLGSLGTLYWNLGPLLRVPGQVDSVKYQTLIINQTFPFGYDSRFNLSFDCNTPWVTHKSMIQSRIYLIV